MEKGEKKVVENLFVTFPFLDLGDACLSSLGNEWSM